MSDYQGIRPEYRKYKWIKMPTKGAVLSLANRMMPLIQKESSHWKSKVTVEEIQFSGSCAQLIRPVNQRPQGCLVYFHGGAFAMKAARYHKNLVRQYACGANLAVLFPDYRLAPRYKYPVPLNDCYEAYQWAAERFSDDPIYVGGDSAGGNLAASLTLKAIEEDFRLPDKLLLIYPVTDSRMTSASMALYLDTPLWNAVLNREMWELYTDPAQRHEMLASPAEAEERYLSRFPETYIETAEYDCLREEGIAFARKLQDCGVKAELHNTEGTIHGFEIEEGSSYVRECVQRRIEFLRRNG